MSSTSITEAGRRGEADWSLIRRQLGGILRLELRRQLFSRRAMVLYFLAFAPVALLMLWALSPVPKGLEMSGPADGASVFAFIYTGYLTTSIFLSSLILFMSLFRAEILEKSLHYYFLSPIRREVLVAGKYVAALIAAAGTFAVATAVLYLVTLSPWGLGALSRYLFNGPGLGHLMTYVGISVLACVGYGALFQLAGQLFRNPVASAVIIWGWELVNPYLPAFLKKLSVIFYLKSLFPIPISHGPFSILAEPTPAWLSIPGLLLFTVVVLTAAGLRARTMEITYAGDD